MRDQDQNKPDFSNVVSGSSGGAGGSEGSGDSEGWSPDFSNVVSGSSSSAPSPAGAEAQSSERVYVVVKGDSLSKISKMFYGDPNSWKRIFDANRDVIHDADLIQPGWKLRIPE